MSKTYSNEEVQEILQVATRMQKDGDISQQQLQEIATEVGISAQTLEKAQQTWLEQQQANQTQTKSRKAFIRFQLIPYLALSVFLILLNLATTPRNFWSVYPILACGLGVAIDGSCLHSKDKKNRSK